MQDKDKFLKKDFSRERKLSLPFLITFILSLVSSGKNQGVDGQLGGFIRNAKRSGVWQQVETVHRSTITRARAKINWTLFEDLFYRVVTLAYELFPQRDDYLWEGMSVFAFDGSKYQLPASEEMRTHFDPKSGLHHNRGHYPLCLVSTVYDVFRRMPIARSITSYDKANEREEAVNLIDKIPSGNVLLFDRGYPSYDFIHYLNVNYEGFYMMRCPAKSSFGMLKAFIQSKKKEAVIQGDIPQNYQKKQKDMTGKTASILKLRVIKLTSPDGTESVLLTNFYNVKKYTRAKLIALYFKRWSIEVHYRDEKKSLNIEQFHSRKVNGVMQEMFAVLITAVIARTLSAIACEPMRGRKTLTEPQFKHAIMTVSNDAFIFYTKNLSGAVDVFMDIMNEIKRVLYYRPIEPRPSRTRVSMTPLNKWCIKKHDRIRSCS